MNPLVNNFIETCKFRKKYDGYINEEVDPNTFNSVFGTTCKFLNDNLEYINIRLKKSHIRVKRKGNLYIVRSMNLLLYKFMDLLFKLLCLGLCTIFIYVVFIIGR